MRRPNAPAPSSLPFWITAACLAAGVWMVCGNSMPALAERDELSRLEDELALLRRRCEAAIVHAERSGAGGGEVPDLQSLFVAIDERGYTISQFCAAWQDELPEPPAGHR